MQSIKKIYTPDIYPSTINHSQRSGRKFRNTNFRTGRILAEETDYWKWEFLKLIKDEFFRVQKAFILDDTNKEKIAFCFNWVIGNIDQSLNKGLLLKGDVGTGKSCIMKAVKNFIKILYPGTFMMYLSADQITHVYRMTGDDFERNLNQIFTCRILFIDDIGYESLLEFGHMPIAEVIRERYDKKRITCITTNMNMEEIEDRYKKSFTDKLGEMCFIINFQGESKR